MSKIVLDNISGGHNLQKINDNFDKIEAEFINKVLYRDEIGAPTIDLDMNGKQIYNLPAPTSLNSAARAQDVLDAVAGAKTAVLTASGGNATIGGLPLQAANFSGMAGAGCIGYTNEPTLNAMYVIGGTQNALFSTSSGGVVSNATMSGKAVQVAFTYLAI